MSMEQFDLSGRSYDQPVSGRSIAALGGDLLITLGGGHPATARRVAPPREVLDLMILGLVLLGTMIMTASTVTTVLHLATGDGQFHVVHALIGALVGCMQGLADNVLQYRRKFLERGAAECRRVGVRLPEIVQRQLLTTLLGLVRALQGTAVGMLAGICVMLAAMQGPIDGYATRKFMTDNPSVTTESTKLVDASIQRTADDLKAATGRVDQINRMLANLRQDNVRRATRTGSRNAAPPSTASETQIAALENTLAAETSAREALTAKLERQQAARNADIEHRIQSSPTAIPKLSGLSGQLQALTALTKDDFKLLVFTVIFQIVSLALELSPMWISLSDKLFPSSYAAAMAMQHFIDVTAIGHEERGSLVCNRPPPK